MKIIEIIIDRKEMINDQNHQGENQAVLT